MLAESAADTRPIPGAKVACDIDFSDISKEFGGDGMEGMEMGWDGSRHCTAMDHDFVSVSVFGSDCPEAIPVYVKLGRGAAIRELYRERKVRFITGRPRFYGAFCKLGIIHSTKRGIRVT